MLWITLYDEFVFCIIHINKVHVFKTDPEESHKVSIMPVAVVCHGGKIQ